MDTMALALGASPLWHIYLRAGSAARRLIDMAVGRVEGGACGFPVRNVGCAVAPLAQGASIPGVSQRVAAPFGPNRLGRDGAERPPLLSV